MTSDASLQPWSIVIVPFPYSERLAEKRRPALIVSNASLLREGYLWIAMITGSAKSRCAGDVPIDNLAEAGLPGPSMVRTSKLATIEPERIVRAAGRLAASERDAVRIAIMDFLAARS